MSLHMNADASLNPPGYERAVFTAPQGFLLLSSAAEMNKNFTNYLLLLNLFLIGLTYWSSQLSQQ